MKVAHDWLKDYLGEKTPSVDEVDKLLTFHSFEIEGVEKVGAHEVIDVDVLPNRSSDCLSHRGIARELATLLNTTLVHDPLTGDITLPETDKLSVTIKDQNACRRFGLALMNGVAVKESPDWLKGRLEALGQRSINNVVDATNYVMLSLGQPLHAYDAGKWKQQDGVWQFGVRFAKEGERIITLTDDEYELDTGVQLIVNVADDTPAGIAGIKGGKYAEVDKDTSVIVLEAANFDPVVTRKASQFLRLQTDASKRFENEPSRELVPHALDAVTKLIRDIAGGEIEGWVDVYPTKQESVTVSVESTRVNALLGLSLEKDKMQEILVRIGASVEMTPTGFLVTGPKERTDLMLEEDFIEEIGRVYGYEHVESVLPETVPLAEINTRHYYSEEVRKVLIEKGFSEVITSSFRKKDDVRLLNALASDKGYLRSSLRKNIEEVLDKNMPMVDLLGIQSVRVFEIGTVFKKGEGEVIEHISLALGVRQKQTGYTQKDDDVVEEVMVELERILGVALSFTLEKGMAELNFTDTLSQLPVPAEYAQYEKVDDIQYRPFSVYPHMSRDIALWTTEGVTANDVEKVLREQAGELCVRITQFDEFTKDGRTSYAFRLVFQSYEKTLTDAEVNTVMEKVYKTVEEKGWEAR